MFLLRFCKHVTANNGMLTFATLWACDNHVDSVPQFHRPREQSGAIWETPSVRQKCVFATFWRVVNGRC